jgi:hypothetical protein
LLPFNLVCYTLGRAKSMIESTTPKFLNSDIVKFPSCFNN